MPWAIVAAGMPSGARGDTAAAVNMIALGGTFGTYLCDLRRNGLITEQGRVCRANDILYPDRSAV
jgi:hypothetical protein